MSHVIKETREDIGLQFYDVFTSIQRGLIDYVAAIKKWENKLLFEGEFAGIKHEEDIAEGDAYKSIKEVRVAAISRAMSREISREISGAVFEANLKVKIEFESREAEEDEQQTELEKTIEDIWKLMQMPKKIYNKMREAVHCKDDWGVKNSEGEDSGALQYKVWKPGRLQSEE
jgi:hypothetical protein